MSTMLQRVRPTPFVLGGLVLVLASVAAIVFKQESSLLYLLGVPVLIISVFNYNWNMAVLFVSLHFAASPMMWMNEYGTPGRWVLLFMLAAKLAMPVVKRGRRTRITAAQVAFLAFTLLALFSSFLSDAFQRSFYRVISLFFLFFAVFITLWRYMDSRNKVETFIRLWVYVSGVMVIIAMVLNLVGFNVGNYGNRFRGFYINPNTLGLLMTTLIPFAYWVTTVRKYNQGLVRIINWIILISSFVSLIWSGSRAAILGVVIGMLVYVALKYRMKMFVYVSLLVAVIGASYGPVIEIAESKFVQQVVYRPQTLSEGSGRLDLWKKALKLSQKRPAIGYGFGTSEVVLWAEGDPLKMRQREALGIHTHNSFLRLLVEMGWVGIFFALVFLFSIFRGVSRLASRAPTEEVHSIAALLGAAIAASIVDSFFESWALSVGCISAFTFWTAIMILYRMNFDIGEFVAEGDTPRAVPDAA